LKKPPHSGVHSPFIYDAQRRRSAAAGSGSDVGADAEGSRLQRFVSLLLIYYAGSRLQLLLQRIEKAPVCSLRDQLLRAALEHAHLVQAERVEAERILGIRVAPTVVGKLLEDVQCHGVPKLVALSYEELRCPLGLTGTCVGCLHERAQRTLGSDRMLRDELPIRRHDTAEVLRPRPVHRGVDKDVPDLLRAEFLGLRREGKEGVCSAVGEQAHCVVEGLRFDPRDVLSRVYTDIGKHARDKQVITDPEPAHSNSLALEIADRVDPLVPEEFVTAHMNAGKHHYRLPAIECRENVEDPKHLDVCHSRGQGVRARGAGGYLGVLDLRKPFETEQLLGEILGREADRRILGQANARGLRRRFGCGEPRNREKRSGAQCRGTGEEPATGESVVVLGRSIHTDSGMVS
jgi:hypothetical protein